MGGRHLLHGSGSLRRIHCGCARTNEACHCGIRMSPVHVTLLKEACNIVGGNYMVHFPTFLCCTMSVFQTVRASASDLAPTNLVPIKHPTRGMCGPRVYNDSFRAGMSWQHSQVSMKRCIFLAFQASSPHGITYNARDSSNPWMRLILVENPPCLFPLVGI